MRWLTANNKHYPGPIAGDDAYNRHLHPREVALDNSQHPQAYVHNPHRNAKNATYEGRREPHFGCHWIRGPDEQVADSPEIRDIWLGFAVADAVIWHINCALATYHVHADLPTE